MSLNMKLAFLPLVSWWTNVLQGQVPRDETSLDLEDAHPQVSGLDLGNGILRSTLVVGWTASPPPFHHPGILHVHCDPLDRRRPSVLGHRSA